MTARGVALVVALAMGAAGAAMAEDAVPDLKGNWTGTYIGGVRHGGGQMSPASKEPSFVHPGDVQFTLTITEQDGRGFKGTRGSTAGSEPVQGVIRLDNKTLLMVDSDSVLEATLLSPTEIELCNHTNSVDEHFSFCMLMKKQ